MWLLSERTALQWGRDSITKSVHQSNHTVDSDKASVNLCGPFREKYEEGYKFLKQFPDPSVYLCSDSSSSVPKVLPMTERAKVALNEVFEPLVKQMEKRVAVHCTRSLSDIDDIVQRARIKFASAVERNVHGSFANPSMLNPVPFQRLAWVCLKQSQIDFGRKRYRFESVSGVHEGNWGCKSAATVNEIDWKLELREALQHLLPSIPASDARIIECIQHCHAERDAACELGMTPVQLSRQKQRIVAKIRKLLLTTGDHHAI